MDAQAARANAMSGWNELRRRFGPVVPVEFEPGITAWLLLGYAENLRVMRDPGNFASDPRRWQEQRAGQIPENAKLRSATAYRRAADRNDGTRHARLRAPLVDSLAHVAGNKLQNETCELAESLIGTFGPQGRADLVADYAMRLPLLVLNRVFGLTDDLGHVLADLLPQALEGEGKQADQAAESVSIYLTGLVERARRNPGDNLTHLLLSHPSGLDKHEVVQALTLLLDAGYEATVATMASTLRALLTDPQLRSDHAASSLPIEELLNHVFWTDPPLGMRVARYAQRDVVLGGAPVRGGDALAFCWTAAHSDPSVRHMNRASSYGIADNRAHLAWGAGPHHCPGQELAAQIVTVGVELLLDRLPDMALAVPEQALAPRSALFSRRLTTLPVRFVPTRMSAHRRAPGTGFGLLPAHPVEEDLLSRLLAWRHSPPRQERHG